MNDVRNQSSEGAVARRGPTLNGYFGSAGFIALAVLNFALARFTDEHGGESLGSDLMGLVLLFAGVAWLLLRVSKTPENPTPHGWIVRTALVLLLGGPWVALALWFVTTAKDVEWMAVPFAVGPALLIGPFWAVAMWRLWRQRPWGRRSGLQPQV